MLEVLLFVCPSLLGLDIYRRITDNNVKKDFASYLSTFGTFMVIINMISLLIVGIYSKISEQLISYLSDRLSFSYKYLLIATILAIVVSYSYDYLEKNFKFRVKVETESKNKQESKKKKEIKK